MDSIKIYTLAALFTTMQGATGSVAEEPLHMDRIHIAATPAAQKLPALQPSAGQVIFFRPSALSFAFFGCEIKENGSALVSLRSGEYAVFRSPPGVRLLDTSISKKPLKVSVVGGERTYVACYMKAKFVSPKPTLHQVNEAEFESVYDNLKSAK